MKLKINQLINFIKLSEQFCSEVNIVSDGTKIEFNVMDVCSICILYYMIEIKENEFDIVINSMVLSKILDVYKNEQDVTINVYDTNFDISFDSGDSYTIKTIYTEKTEFDIKSMINEYKTSSEFYSFDMTFDSVSKIDKLINIFDMDCIEICPDTQGVYIKNDDMKTKVSDKDIQYYNNICISSKYFSYLKFLKSRNKIFKIYFNNSMPVLFRNDDIYIFISPRIDDAS